MLSRSLEQLSGWAALLFRALMRILGPVMFVGANVLTLLVIWLFMFRMLPRQLPEAPLSYAFHCLFVLWLAPNIMCNYWACAITPPGSPERESASAEAQQLLGAEGGGASLVLDPGVSYKFCASCSCVRPPRAHHCSVLNRCVYHFDHFCPWMCTTVGYGNYRYFVLFLLYMTLGALYIVLYTLADLLHMSPAERSHISLQRMFQTNLLLTSQSGSLTAATFCFSVGLSALLSAGSLLAWHAYLALSNQTSVEFYENLTRAFVAQQHGLVFRNAFDEGWRKNMRRVFGDAPWYRHLLPHNSPPPPPRYAFVLDAAEYA
ncbi:DHHC palmitoyltransferase-domain-containing protein [Ochromonadaceae sp. CCMP2298]|nr:DHHC palmitoyltransferase-domain-containing protein [Ochromonadaceae sp. CCMP2298]